MSTKQSVIFTFMVLFLGVMLFCMASYFYWSIEHDVKEKNIKALVDKEDLLERELTSEFKDESGRYSGLRKQLDDPERGLRTHELPIANEAAVNAKGNDVAGAKLKETRYAAWQSKLEGMEPKVKTKWQDLYKNWHELDGKIKAVMVTRAKQSKEKDDRLDAVRLELKTEADNEAIERSKSILDRKKNESEITTVRIQQQELHEKTEAVSRELGKKVAIHKQGEVIFSASDELKFVVIDKGAINGVKRGNQFGVFANFPGGIVQKGLIEVTQVNATSSHAVLIQAKGEVLKDEVTGYETTDTQKHYSPFSATSSETGLDASPLTKPKTKQDRLDLYRQEKFQATQALQNTGVANGEVLSAPPMSLGLGFTSILVGDWIFSKDFVPLLTDAQFEEQTRSELISMKNVNTGSLVFYFADSIKPYRQEYLKRVCERNQCRVVDSMTNDVSYVITSTGTNSIALLKEKLDPKNKLKTKEEIEKAANNQEDATADIKSTRRTLAALLEAQKLGAEVMLDDDLDAFFTRRQRKMELLRGKVIQPGQSNFYVAGETKTRSAENLRKWIVDHKGVVATSLDSKVDYVVVGSGLDQAFYDKIKSLGMKIIREDELPHFFGVETQR